MFCGLKTYLRQETFFTFWPAEMINFPSLLTIKKTICCPKGKCIAPYDCYALDRSRSYPVHIHDAAEALLKLLRNTLQDGDHRV